PPVVLHRAVGAKHPPRGFVALAPRLGADNVQCFLGHVVAIGCHVRHLYSSFNSEMSSLRTARATSCGCWPGAAVTLIAPMLSDGALPPLPPARAPTNWGPLNCPPNIARSAFDTHGC